MVKFKRVNYDILSSPALQDTESQILHFYLHVNTVQAEQISKCIGMKF